MAAGRIAEVIRKKRLHRGGNRRINGRACVVVEVDALGAVGRIVESFHDAASPRPTLLPSFRPGYAPREGAHRRRIRLWVLVPLLVRRPRRNSVSRSEGEHWHR